jgi:hypothetical protein
MHQRVPVQEPLYGNGPLHTITPASPPRACPFSAPQHPPLNKCVLLRFLLRIVSRRLSYEGSRRRAMPGTGSPCGVPERIRGPDEYEGTFTLTPTNLDTLDARAPQPSLDLGQVLAAVEMVTDDDTVGCDLILARGWVMGAPAGLENGQCAFEPGISSEELEQDHIV